MTADQKKKLEQKGYFVYRADPKIVAEDWEDTKTDDKTDFFDPYSDHHHVVGKFYFHLNSYDSDGNYNNVSQIRVFSIPYDSREAAWQGALEDQDRWEQEQEERAAEAGRQTYTYE
ncbi:MAG: hypothetical protein ACLP9L_32850 [Thermoguttaceae bacterium]